MKIENHFYRILTTSIVVSVFIGILGGGALVIQGLLTANGVLPRWSEWPIVLIVCFLGFFVAKKLIDFLDKLLTP